MPTPPNRRKAPKRQAAVRRESPSPQHSIFRTLQSDHPSSGFAIVPLRLFLGITFVYAALQKIADPGFFRAGSPTYIGTQILAFSRGSPIQGLLHHLMQYAVAVGALTVITEGCVGVLVLLGLVTRPAALVGMALSMGFFLSASWNTYPYFFGSDIVFVVCWLTLAITGPGVFALDSIVEAPILASIVGRDHRGISPGLLSVVTGWHVPNEPPISETAVNDSTVSAPNLRAQLPRHRLTRGEALVGALATFGLVALGLHPRRSGGTGPANQLASGGKTTSALPTPGPKSGTAPSTPGNGPTIPTGARKIGNISQVPVNSAGTVSDPKSGDPAVIVHTSGSEFVAFDAICTHAGCTVQYDPQQKLLVCPCHGGAFDPAHGAQVVAGPPPSPLTPIDMTIDSQGNIYIV